MKKWILLSFFLLATNHFSNDSQKMIEHKHSIAPQKFSAKDSAYFHPDRIQTDYLKVVPMSVTGFCDQGLKKLNAAFNLLERVMNSEEFKDRVLNFKNSKGERAFASNDGLSNEEIYEQVMEGRETLRPNTPGEMNFDLKLYSRWWSKVIGYTTPTTNLININNKFFKNFEPHEVAANLAHEWMHKIGFDHLSAAEHDSAPYAIGYIVEEMAAKLSALPIQKVSQR
jgi:hypothetical protein